MPRLTVKQLAEIVDAELFSADPDFAFSLISIDSRTVLEPAKTVFFALKTERNDGHRYLEDLIHQGVKVFVVSDIPEPFLNSQKCHFIKHANTLDALQKLAAWHRSQFVIPVVGITGSNAKTIVKEWLFSLLQNHVVLRSPKSYNSQVGVPLSVWNLSPDDELAIFEAGISKPGEMEKLAGIIRPTIGIFTTIGDAHQEGFASREEKLQEKLKLFESCKALIYCKDQEVVHQVLCNGYLPASVELVSWSYTDQTADLYFYRTENPDGTEISVRFGNDFFRIRLPFTDQANLENAGHCLAFVLSQKMADPVVLNSFGQLQAVAMRLEIKEGINNCLLINDYYNSDINSLQIALSFFGNHAIVPYRRKVVILSDIQQAGIADQQLYREVSKLLVLNKIDYLIGIGHKLKEQAAAFELQADFFETVDEFISGFRFKSFSYDCILLKGARQFQFERISSALQKKYHQTILEIDLNAMIDNLNLFRGNIMSETKLMVMVKAFSYGTGMAEIARVLQFHKVDYLAVAVADEGIELRNAGIELPIVVMNPEEHSFENMIEFRLEPNLYSFEVFDAFRKALLQHAVIQYPVHLKLDTGMHRLGFDPEQDVDQLCSSLLNQDQIMVRSVFSHLAAADEVSHDEFTLAQISRFVRFCATLEKKLPYRFMRHILNSAGIERFPEYQFEMVRLGIGLYGVSCGEVLPVKSIGRFKTAISQIRSIPAGQTVGYGRKGLAKKETTIAILPVGYADGYDRRLSNGTGKVFLNGKVAPVIGNICMDMCMIDVTGIPVSVGDEVELMGEHIKVEQIAADIGTIPYEILTGISQRVKRVYIQE